MGGGGGGGFVAGGVVAGGEVCGGEVGGGDVGVGLGVGFAAGGADDPAPEGGALGEAAEAWLAPDRVKVVALAPGAVPVTGAGGAPVAGGVTGVAAASAAPVGVSEPLGAVAAAGTAATDAATVVLTGAADASVATRMNVAVALRPVVSTRVAAAGRLRLANETMRMAVLLTRVLHRFAQAVVAPGTVVGSRTGARRRGGRGRRGR